jgi:DNA replication and repair protein RecF
MTPDEPPAAARVERLRLTDFRNHVALALEVGGRSVVLTGPNGAGKTNVLEALSLLAPGRGFRRARLADLPRHGGSGAFAVSADVGGPWGDTVIGVGAEPDDAQRRIRINGEARPAEELSEYLRVLWLVPAMDGLFTGSAADRRRFLDRLVLTIDPGHGRRVARYEAAVSSRNRLLEDRQADAAWLDAVEAEIAGTGTAVAAARRETVGCLSRLIAGRPDDGGFPRAALALEGDVDAALAGASAADVEDWLRADLFASRSRDRAAGRTLGGPHRSDLSVRHAEKDMPAALSSTGEQKALLIGLVLAQAALVSELTGFVPLLLFDEIAAHLDARRRRALFDLVEALGAQAFMTGTDAEAFSALSGRANFVELGV